MVSSDVQTWRRSVQFLQDAPRIMLVALRLVVLSLLATAGTGASDRLEAQERVGTGFARWDATLAGAPATMSSPAPTSSPPPTSMPSTRIAAPPADPLLLTIAGLAGSFVGVFAGGYMGYHIDRQSDHVCDYCGLTGLLLGAAIGSAVLTPLAVHA